MIRDLDKVDNGYTSYINEVEKCQYTDLSDEPMDRIQQLISNRFKIYAPIKNPKGFDLN